MSTTSTPVASYPAFGHQCDVAAQRRGIAADQGHPPGSGRRHRGHAPRSPGPCRAGSATTRIGRRRPPPLRPRPARPWPRATSCSPWRPRPPTAERSTTSARAGTEQDGEQSDAAVEVNQPVGPGVEAVERPGHGPAQRGSGHGTGLEERRGRDPEAVAVDLLGEPDPPPSVEFVGSTRRTPSGTVASRGARRGHATTSPVATEARTVTSVAPGTCPRPAPRASSGCATRQRPTPHDVVGARPVPQPEPAVGDHRHPHGGAAVDRSVRLELLHGDALRPAEVRQRVADDLQAHRTLHARVGVLQVAPAAARRHQRARRLHPVLGRPPGPRPRAPAPAWVARGRPRRTPVSPGSPSRTSTTRPPESRPSTTAPGDRPARGESSRGHLGRSTVVPHRHATGPSLVLSDARHEVGPAVSSGRRPRPRRPHHVSSRRADRTIGAAGGLLAARRGRRASRGRRARTASTGM